MNESIKPAHPVSVVERAAWLADVAEVDKGAEARLWEILGDLTEAERGALDVIRPGLPALLEKLRTTQKMDLGKKLNYIGELVKERGFPPKPLVEEQAPPAPNDSKPIWELVVEDMLARDKVGRERYGTPLQAHNGRNALVDAYQEALDLVVYQRQALEEKGLSIEPLPQRDAMAKEICRLRECLQDAMDSGRFLHNKVVFLDGLRCLGGRRPLSVEDEHEFESEHHVSESILRQIETRVLRKLEEQMSGEAMAFTWRHSEEISRNIEERQRKKVEEIDKAWAFGKPEELCPAVGPHGVGCRDNEKRHS